jgi:hypothetical protein
MSPEAVFFGIGFIATVGVVVWGIPGTWSGRNIAGMNAASKSFWLWGEGSRRAFVRGTVVGTLTALCIMLGGFCGTLFESSTNDGIRGLLALGFIVCLALAVLGTALLVTISLFNWPHAAVPPSLRGEDGMVPAWRKRRSETHRKG